MSKPAAGRNAMPVTRIERMRSARHMRISSASSELSHEIPEIAVPEQSVRFDLVDALARTVWIAVRHLYPALAQNTPQESVDRGLMIERLLDPAAAAVKYVIRPFLDPDDIGAFGEDFPGRLGQCREEFCLGGFEIALERRGFQPAHQRERDQQRRCFHIVKGDRRRQVVSREPESALRAAFGLDRDAERDQPVDVPIDGTD